MTGELRGLSRSRAVHKVLEGALSPGQADRGNVQLVDPATASLVIVAEHGFGAEFLEYFAAVDDVVSTHHRHPHRPPRRNGQVTL